MIACSKCGHENELGRIFCYQCGERLDLQNVPPPKESKSFWRRARAVDKKKKKESVGHGVWQLIRILIIFSLVAAIVLMLIPTNVQVQTGDAKLKDATNAKVKAMIASLEQQKPGRFDFAEDEINALTSFMVAEEGDAGFGSFLLQKREIEVGDNYIATILRGKMTFGNVLQFPMTVRLAGRLRVLNGQLDFEETRLEIGRLPIPQFALPVFGFLLNRVSNFWEDESLKHPREMLGRAKSVSIQKRTVVVEVGPKP